MSDARRLRIGLIALVAAMMPALAALAAVCGDPAPEPVQETPAVVNYTPRGDAARLGLEVVDDTISCDGGKHEVRVWLDDLPRQPTIREDYSPSQGVPTPAPTTTGVIAYEFRFKYDPAVVWVADRTDVDVPAELDTAGAGMAIDRNFTATARIDNHKGETLAGGLALGLTAGMDPTDVAPGDRVPLPPGIDPVAAGGPLLIMTIAVTPVGGGETTLSLEEAELYADYYYRMTPLETVSASVAVDGANCAKLETATPLTTPTAHAPAASTQTPLPQVAPVTPVPAAEKGRSDCPASWAAWRAASFSICYPLELEALASVAGIGLATVHNYTPPLDASLPRIYVLVQRSTTSSLTKDDSGQVDCSYLGTTNPQDNRVEAFIGDNLLAGCSSVIERNSPAGPLSTAFYSLQLDDQTYLNVTANARVADEGSAELVQSILRTLRTE